MTVPKPEGEVLELVAVSSAKNRIHNAIATAPITMLAIASPRPRWPVRLHCRSPMRPKVTPNTPPRNGTHPSTIEQINAAIEKPLVVCGW